MELESLYISFPRWSLVGTATYIQNPEHVVSPGVLVSPEMPNGILKKRPRPFAVDCFCFNRPTVDVFDVRGSLTVKLGIISVSRLGVSKLAKQLSLLLMVQISGDRPVDLVPIKKHPRWCKISSINSIFLFFLR